MSEGSDDLIREVLAEVIRRRADGEKLTDEEVLAAHPQFGEALSGQLRRLRLIANARNLAEQDPVDVTIDYDSKHIRQDGFNPGDRIRHYVLKEQIGTGGFGTVWLACDSKLETDVALKILRGGVADDHVDAVMREARLAAQLRKHPHIVTVLDADWEGDRFFIVADFIEGMSLRGRMAQSRLSNSDAVDLLITTSAALHHAHETGIIHRDLKPANVLLDHAEKPHVADFGLAKQMDVVVPSETGKIMGTPAYIPRQP